MKEELYIFDHKPYIFYKSMMRVTGLWPFQSAVEKIAILATHFLISGTNTVTQVAALMRTLDDFSVTVECISSILVGVDVMLQLIMFVSYNYKFRKIFRGMQNTTESFDTEGEKQKYWQLARAGNMQSVSYLVLMYTCGIFYILLAAVPKIIPSLFSPNSTDTGLPYRVYYPYVNSYLEGYYLPLLFHSALGLLLRITIINAVNSMMILFINHACALFATISYRMDHLLEEEEEGNMRALKETGNDSLKVVGYCVDRHNEIANFMELATDIFSAPYVLQYGIIMINLSFTGVQALAENQSIRSSFKFLSSCAAQGIHLFIQSNTGQDIIKYSEAAHQSIYASRWDRLPLKTQRALRIMMMKTMTPCTFSVGKILVICFETYSAVLRTSASYFTVLRSFQ